MLRSQLYQSTIDFDLISGDLPKRIKRFFEDQVQRARAILKNRTVDEINYVVSSLDWMLQRGSNKLFLEAMQGQRQLDHKHILNRVKALKSLVDEFDISDQSQFQNATWAEYFAVLALALVAEMLVEETFDKTRNFPPDKKAFFNALDGGINAFTHTPWAVQAMEAVCYAEQLESEAKLLSETVKEEMRVRGTKGAKVKSSKYDEIYRKIHSLYDEKYSNRTNRDAAKRIYAELKDETDNTFNTDDPEKQIEKVIGRYVNGKMKKS